MAVNTKNAPVFVGIDTRQFQKTLTAYAATTKKDRDAIVNEAAVWMAGLACKHTRHADVNKIRALKEVSSVQAFGKSGKKLKAFDTLSKSQRERRTTYQATPAAVKIFLHWEHKRGVDIKSKYGSWKAIEAAALRMVNARISSVHYLRSGWLQAMAAFRGVVKKNPTGLPKMKNPGPGGAKISVGGRATAEIWNSSLYSKNEGGVSMGLYKYAKQGLQMAVAQSTARLIQITKERLAKAAARANAG